MRAKPVFLVLLFLFLALAGQLPAQEGVQAWFNADTRTWTLGNQLIQAQYRLNSNNQLRILTLRRVDGKQWVAGSRPAVSPIYLKIDDVVLNSNTAWELVSTREENAPRGGRRHMIQLRNAEAKAEVTLRIEIHPGQPFIRSYFTYRNIDETTHYVQEARFLHLRVNPELRPMRGFYVEQYRQGTPLMFGVYEQELAQQPGRRVTVFGGAHADHCTYLALRDSEDNGLAIGWEFDGKATLNAQLSPRGDRVDIWGSPINLNAPVGADRELRIPGAFVGLFEGDWDEAGYRTQRYAEAVLAHPLPDDGFPYLMFDTWAYEQNINESLLRRAADRAAYVGVEVFVVDLGWAKNIGDWEDDPAKFPGGLRAFGDYVRRLGMKFGLHFVPVEASAQAPVLQLRPDWTSSINNYYFGAESICISNAPTQAWLREATRTMIERYQPDWLVQDGENLVKECTKETHTHNPLNSNWANSVNGLDLFVKYARAQAPSVLWENNGDGGTMSTFEAIKNYVTFSSCDACEHMPRRQAVWGMSYVFPPRYIDRYMSEPPIKFTTRSSMFGGPWILMHRLAEMSQAELALLRQEAGIYKSLRGLIREGKVYHLTGRPNGYQNEAIESFHPEWNRGVVFVYRPDSPSSSQMIYPRGLVPEKMYRVTFQETSDSRIDSGANLMSRGITVKLPTKNFAEIVYINGL